MSSCGNYLLPRQSSVRSVNSDLEAEGENEEAESVYISGNLNFKPINNLECGEEEDDDDYESDQEEFVDCVEKLVDEESINLIDIEKADRILSQTFGINNCIKQFVGLLLNDQISVTDIAVQGFVYKVQSVRKGSRSLRYLPSWGMFWAGIRNLIKSRGLVPFSEHFCIPTRLSTFRDKIINMCGLQKEMLGKPGLQEQNVRLFVDGKKKEIKSGTLCFSLSLDGKKIAVTQDGREDMGGLSNSARNSDVDERNEIEKQEILSLIDKNDRQSLFTLYNHLSKAGENIICNIAAVECLIKTNNKRLEKNPRLGKYIFILNQKLLNGTKLLKTLDSIQARVIKLISLNRNCLILLPLDNSKFVDLRNQPNFFKLSNMEEQEEIENITAVGRIRGKRLLEMSITDLERDLSRPLHNIPRGSRSFDAIHASYVKSNQVYKACGLRSMRPLQDMKTFYQQCQQPAVPGEQPPMASPNSRVVATFCAQFSPLTFGGNFQVNESGMFAGNKVLSTPDLVVVNKAIVVTYCVEFVAVETNTFKCTEEMFTAAIMSAHSSNAAKGCLLVLYSEISCVVFSVSNNSELCQAMLSLIWSYSTATKCLSKRSQELLKQIEKIKSELKDCLNKITTLGCYPLVQVYSLDTSKEVKKNNFILPSAREIACLESFDYNLLKEDLGSFLNDIRVFEAKSAKELIAVNVSDMSGNCSNYPHTILGATYLSSASLKVVTKDIIREATDMLNKMGVEVLNVGVDGESLGLATSLPNGAPGTLLSLAKYLLKKLQLFSKSDLVKLCTENRNILISEVAEIVNANEDVDDYENVDVNEEVDALDNFDNHFQDAIAAITTKESDSELFTLEDLEMWLGSDEYCKERESECKKMTKPDLKIACLKYMFPKAKKAWLSKFLENGGFKIVLEHAEIFYVPNTVFSKSNNGYFQTVTFDTAHIANLLRESAAKNRLAKLGLSLSSLKSLGDQKEFGYLKKIVSLKNQQSLEYDPMSQSSSYLLFSLKTELGLRKMNDDQGANLCKLIREGIIESLDKSGVSAEDRIINIYKLKLFLDEKISVFDQLKKAGNVKDCITNELLQMIHASLDSHVTTFANLEYFNPRRKCTGSVEQFFSQITLMCEGGSKLHCREISDILQRVMITNALRVMPISVKGFSFLAALGRHMTSYSNDVPDEVEKQDQYPKLMINNTIIPQNSSFDKQQKKYKRKISMKNAGNRGTSENRTDGNVRKYHKKF